MNPGEAPVQYAPVSRASAPRIKLVVQKGPSEGTEIECRRIVTLIGSRTGCKVVLNHRDVAPVHVAIFNDGTHVHAADLVTARGTKLNALKMEQEELTDGDVLTVGRWEFRVDISQPTSLDEIKIELEPTPEVVALEHIPTGRILKPNREICIIGRRNGCDINISDQRVSRTHTLLLNYLGHPTVFDLLSTRTTRVNGDAVGFCVLKADDLIEVGESRFRVRIAGAFAEPVEPDPSGASATPKPPPAVPPTTDLIDIGHVEGSQRWHIAENLEKASRKP